MKSVILKPHEAKGIHDGSITELWREVRPQTRTVLQSKGSHFGFLNMGDGTFQERITIGDFSGAPHLGERFQCPYPPGTRLWCKETWGYSARIPSGYQQRNSKEYQLWDASTMAHRSDNPKGIWMWRPSTHMPQWASRTTIEITAVTVEQKQGKWFWKYTVKTTEG